MTLILEFIQIKYIVKPEIMLQFESFSILNEEIRKENPDMLPLETKIPAHSEILDFTKNIGAMLVKKNQATGIIRMSCEARDYRIGVVYKKGFWGKFPKGFIHFNLNKIDWKAPGTEDQELAGANYMSDTGKYTLLIIND